MSSNLQVIEELRARVLELEKQNSGMAGTISYHNVVLAGYAAEHERILNALDRAGQERDLPIEPRVERLCERFNVMRRECETASGFAH